MPFTHHGHEHGNGPLDVRPPLVARCGGPALCRECARDVGRLNAPPVGSGYVIELSVIEQGERSVRVAVRAVGALPHADLASVWLERAELARNGGRVIADGLRVLAASVEGWSRDPGDDGHLL